MTPVKSMACDGCGLDLCASCHRGLDAGLVIREIDVIRLMATGLSDADITRRMSCCAMTTANRLDSIKQKLGVRNRVEIIGWAIGHGVVPYNTLTVPFRGTGMPTHLVLMKSRTA
jgi:DNA-binding CsgD family transcriptional regulator